MLSNLNAEQKHSLQSMLPLLGLAADLTHGSVTIYVPGVDRKSLYIYRQEHPLTQVGMQRPNLSGRKLRAVEEPLVLRALQKNIALSGKREWNLGEFNNLRVFPLRDGWGRSYAAISFETNSHDDEIIVNQSLELLQNTTSSLADNPNYARMQPSDGIMVVDLKKQIIAANKRARYIFDVMGIPDIIGRRTNDVNINWPLVSMVVDTGIAESKEFTMHKLLLNIRIIPVLPQPKAGCAIVIVQDVTELRKKDEELLLKSVVIKEIHHRVKNNLQTIASLLRLQERRSQNNETKTVLQDCLNRVNSIAIVHEYLSQQDADLIEVDKVVKGIYKAILSSMTSPELQLTTELRTDSVQLPSHMATSLALILNELLQNALEHAFEGRSEGRVEIDFKESAAAYVLTIADDGIGLPDDFVLEGRKSLGLKIIKTMAESDLRGHFILQNRAGGGTLAVVDFPKMGVS